MGAPEPDWPAWKVWGLACRPKTLPAAAAPVILGTACARALGAFRPAPALAALFGALALQIAANLANDVFDFERGTDTAARLGPLRVTQAGLLTPRQVRRGLLTVIGLALAAGAYLAWVAGWPIVILGLASILAALAYTSGPFPLAHHGWGEPFVLLFFGFAAVGGSAFVQLGRVPPAAWWGGAAIGFLATAILVVNNTRDAATDREAGRTTIPARWGRRAGVIELGVCFAGGYAASVGLGLAGGVSPWPLLCLATFPLALVILARVARRTDGPALNRALAATGMLLLAHSLLASLGLVWGGRG